MQQLGIIMPTAVIMEENFDKLLEQCEAQELEVRSRFVTLFCICAVLIIDFQPFVSDGLVTDS